MHFNLHLSGICNDNENYGNVYVKMQRLFVCLEKTMVCTMKTKFEESLSWLWSGLWWEYKGWNARL